jgi:hypothetical protein
MLINVLMIDFTCVIIILATGHKMQRIPKSGKPLIPSILDNGSHTVIL